MTVILPFFRVIHSLTPEEFFEFCNSILHRSQADVTNIPRLTMRYDLFQKSFAVFSNGVNRPWKAPETKKIKLLDDKRRGVFTLIDDAVRKSALYSIFPNVLEAANALIPILDIYAGTPDIEYEGETGAIDDMLKEFDKPENAAFLAILGQTDNVAALRQINIEFQAIYVSRLENRYVFKQGGTARQRRKALLEELGTFCEGVNGLLVTATDPDEIIALKSIVAIINATIEQYTVVVNKHLGVLAAKRKNNDKRKKDSDNQTGNTPPESPDDKRQPDDSDESKATDKGE